jgi:hypothetical protein
LPNDSETKLFNNKIREKKFKLPNDDDEEAKLVRKNRGKKIKERKRKKVANSVVLQLGHC